jgi:DNA-binding NarL/FixJ family response regulator
MRGTRITVLLADDHALVRRGFRRLLEDDPEIEVAGEAGDGPAAVEAAAKLLPDVVVLDYALPGMDGAEAARRILQNNPKIAVLMLSMHAEPAYVRTCLRAGAKGYLLKNAMDLELNDAVKRVAAGESVLDPCLDPATRSSNTQQKLTARELDVLQLIVNGKSNKEIADILKLSINTVSVHRANIMQTLELHNTAELVVYAIREGLASIA